MRASVGILAGKFYTLGTVAFIVNFAFLQFFFNFGANAYVPLSFSLHPLPPQALTRPLSQHDLLLPRGGVPDEVPRVRARDVGGVREGGGDYLRARVQLAHDVDRDAERALDLLRVLHRRRGVHAPPARGERPRPGPGVRGGVEGGGAEAAEDVSGAGSVGVAEVRPAPRG